MNNNLIYGKNDEKFIVGMDPKDGYVLLYIQNPDGSISEKEVPNKYWLLAHESFDNSWVRLKGDLHFKWGKQFSKIGEFYKTKKYLKDCDIFTMNDLKENFMVNKGYTFYKGLNPKDVSILSFDIESTGLKYDDSAKILLISNTYRNKDKITRKLFSYDEYDSQGEMLEAWCSWVRKMDPSIICGHNIFGFDLSYIKYIADREEIKLLLGRDKSVIKFDNYLSDYEIDGSRTLSYKKAFIQGRQIIDTLFLAYKFDMVAKKYSSYGLKAIIESEGLIASNRTFYDASQIRFKYTIPEEWAKIKEYCKDDADDSLKLFDLMAPPYFYMCQSIPKSFQIINWSRTGSPLNSIMCRAYLQDMHSLPKAMATKKYEGAISLGNPGIYKNCIKWDVTSLYPSIILQYQIYDKEKDPKAYFLEMVQTFTEERIKNKKLFKTTGDKYYDDLQNAQKVLINSCYGFLGTPGLNFNSQSKVELVTEKGREILVKAIEWATGEKFEKTN